MKLDKKTMLLYAVTDRAWLNGRELKDLVEQCVQAGATFVQLREKDLSEEAFIAEAKKIKEVTDRYQVPFVINDNIQVAKAVDADGVHVGQGDMNPKEIRAILGEDKIIGVSAQTVEQAKKAQEDGAHYIGVGAAFATSTKEDAKPITKERFQEITRSVDIPVVAIGGISKQNILQLKGTGVDGVAVVSAIFAQSDIAKATEELLALSKEMVAP